MIIEIVKTVQIAGPFLAIAAIVSKLKQKSPLISRVVDPGETLFELRAK